MEKFKFNIVVRNDLPSNTFLLVSPICDHHWIYTEMSKEEILLELAKRGKVVMVKNIGDTK